MDFFNSLWDDPDQTVTPSSVNFGEEVTVEKWMNFSSTYKTITGSFNHPQDLLQIERYFDDKAKKTQNAHTSYEKKQNAPKQPPKLKNISKPTPPENTETMDGSESDSVSEAESWSSETHTHKYVPGLRKDPCPGKISSLDIHEHAQCLALYIRFSNYTGGIMLSDRSDHIAFELMYQKVKEEQAAFNQDALSQWQEVANTSQQVSEANMRLLQILWVTRMDKTLDLYPHLYKRRLMVPLLPGDFKVEMIKMSDLLQMGRIPAFFHPRLSYKTTAKPQISKILISTQYNIKADQVIGSLHKLPVSFDPNAESLARLYKAHIVVSTGALKTLLQTYYDFSKSWTLPITVKEYRTIEKGKTTTKTIVFIDKPFPKPSMTAYECDRFLFKHTVKARLTQRNHQLCFTFPIPGVETLQAEVQVKEEPSETEDTPTPAPEEPPPENNPLQKEDMDVSTGANDSDEERLVIEEEEPVLQTTITSTTKEETQPEPPPCTPASVSSTTSGTQIKKEPLKRQDGVKLPKTREGFTAPISQANVTYSSWVIRPENDDQLSVHQKKAQRELTVIVRCQMDACERVDEDIVAVSISPKVEYQLDFGIEEPTKEELVGEWASVLFKPASVVARARVDAKTGEIVMCEKINKLQIAADAKRIHNVRLNDSLQTLYSVFSELSSLTKGSYLLHHSPEENAFAALEESVNEVGENCFSVRNLKDYLNQKFSVDFVPNPAWRKIDCKTVMPRHNSLKVMPATYRPKPPTLTFKARNIPCKPEKEFDRKNPRFPTKKKKKKKKNRTKKKNDQKPKQEDSNMQSS